MNRSARKKWKAIQGIGCLSTLAGIALFSWPSPCSARPEPREQGRRRSAWRRRAGPSSSSESRSTGSAGPARGGTGI